MFCYQRANFARRFIYNILHNIHRPIIVHVQPYRKNNYFKLSQNKPMTNTSFDRQKNRRTKSCVFDHIFQDLERSRASEGLSKVHISYEIWARFLRCTIHKDLKVYHNIVNHFAPKSSHFFYESTFAR